MRVHGCPLTLITSVLFACYVVMIGSPVPLGALTKKTIVSKHPTSGEQSVDSVPMKIGLWEETLFQAGQLVSGPTKRQEMCSGLFLYSPFLSVPSNERFGSIVLQKVLEPDLIWKLPDGRYRVTGGRATTASGDVTYTHLVTLHDDTHYDDVLTLTLNARAHPVKHFYTGVGHWIAPCGHEYGNDQNQSR